MLAEHTVAENLVLLLLSLFFLLPFYTTWAHAFTGFPIQSFVPSLCLVNDLAEEFLAS